MKILILGGYGTFGGRLAKLLADISQLELIIAGRNLARAQEFCRTFAGDATVRAWALDRAQIAGFLDEESPDLVVDASGPFQSYGAAPYGVVAACIAAKIDYLDLADAADFVLGISDYDAAAQQAGVAVLSGVSSFPVLTAAVLRDMAQRMDLVDVEGGIAPSPHAGIGLNVMRAVLGYAGSPVNLWRDGKPSTALGLAESRRFIIAPPGCVPLRSTHFSLVDVPDLQIIPQQHATLDQIWMGAGPVPEYLHRMLNVLAKLRARLGLPSFAGLAPLFHGVLNRLSYGEHRGGMYIQARGRRNGQDRTESWHMVAEGDDGPYIPSMAAESLIRKRLAGDRLTPGARPAVHALDLCDYKDLFENRDIHFGFRGDPPPNAPPYVQVLSSHFDQLPPMLQTFHGDEAPPHWVGVAAVAHGPGTLAKIVRWVFNFPKSGDHVPIKVKMERQDQTETWTRVFDGKTFSSTQRAGQGRNQHVLIERFGAISVALALDLQGQILRVVPRGWWLLGIPMPMALCPSGDIFETQQDQDFCFNVEIKVPLIGLIVSYKGQLRPDDQ